MLLHRLALCGAAALAVVMPQVGRAAPQTLYGLVQTDRFNELLTYDLTQDAVIRGGYAADSLAPLNFTNLLPQNSITSIAVSGNTLYGLIKTDRFNELITFDLTQDSVVRGGYAAESLAPLNFTNLLPQNSIDSIAVSGNTLYGLIKTDRFNELITFDLTQDAVVSGGYAAESLAPLNFTNLLPQNSIDSIAVSGNTLYGLIKTDRFDELITYDLTRDAVVSGGYAADSLAPLNFTNLLPPNSIVSIALDALPVTSPPGDGGGSTSVPEPGSSLLWIVGMLGLVIGYGRVGSGKSMIPTQFRRALPV